MIERWVYQNGLSLPHKYDHELWQILNALKEYKSIQKLRGEVGRRPQVHICVSADATKLLMCTFGARAELRGAELYS